MFFTILIRLVANLGKLRVEEAEFLATSEGDVGLLVGK